jgi:hypothetical protein
MKETMKVMEVFYFSLHLLNDAIQLLRLYSIAGFFLRAFVVYVLQE